MIVVLMGVSGSGKTTIGMRLAAALDWSFHDGDDLHSPANVRKMQSGHPLDDADRVAWLTSVRRLIDTLAATNESSVIACSALRDAYRHVLADGRPEVRFVWLRGDPVLLRDRLAKRKGHFMPAALLDSQLETLEPPADALALDVTPSPEAIVTTIRRDLGV
ncbi:MAG TPA: gluconokinase [Candidatus Binatia bacterium]|nr:gluconokinase [Candidatus Binatia bacterium]